MTHYFTPEEANKELSEVSKVVARIVQLNEAVDSSAGKKQDEAIDELSLLMSKLDEKGIEIKDMKMGLIDFPAMRFGEQVYLCWKLGENEVLYWHNKTEGFRGRKLLKPELTQIR